MLAPWRVSGRVLRITVSATMLCILAYTCMLVVLWPGRWMDPLGGMARNLAVLPALAMSWVLSERR